MNTINIESTTLFDLLPTEIIFIIFNYLSSNDIIYTFFFFNQRLNHLLLYNQRYFNYLELPIVDLNTWENILSNIGSQIESLNITTNYLSFSLKYFSNLKSIIISSPYGLPDEELKSIIESKQFKNLDSFKVKEDQIFSSILYNKKFFDKDYLFKRIFNHENSLQTLTIPLFHVKIIDNLNVNFNLHSMTLNIIYFENIFLLIQHTPNLEYLNVDSYMSRTNKHQISVNKINIKLKQLYLTFKYKAGTSNSFDQLINGIKQFSSSLTCLSLNLVDLYIKIPDEFPFNSIKLQQFLESMKELKEIHLYAKTYKYSINCDKILSGFKNKYWFDHNWSFGMHRNYFYTLPFHFDYLYEFYGGFKNVKSNNPSILIKNRRIWYNVKSIELERSSNYNRNFVKELKIKMPKLNLIKFCDHLGAPKRYSSSIIDEREKNDIRLDNVTTIQFTHRSIEDERDWIISSLPNLRHLTLCYGLIFFDSKLVPILNERITRLDIDMYSHLKHLSERNYFYFSNVQYINFCLSDFKEQPELYADVVIKILTNFKNLKSLLIYIHRTFGIYINPSCEAKLIKLIEHLNTNEIMKNYKVKHFREYALFLKRGFNGREVQDVAPLCVNNESTLTDHTVTFRKPSFFSRLIRLFC